MSQTRATGQSEIETVMTGLLKDVLVLVRQEMALAKHEIQYEIDKIFRVVLWCGIAAVLAVIGMFMIATVCVLILFEYTGLPAWACAVVVTVILLGGAWGIAVVGSRIAGSINVVPLRTVRSLMGDAKWMAEWVRTRLG
ncbi:MAG: phage holin family protein [Nitrospirota bacterium]